MEKYKIMLRKGSKKDFCPKCDRKSFKPYVWADTCEVINPNLGHCDHEISCGRFDTLQAVWDYIKGKNIDVSQHKEIEVKQLPTYTFPTDVLERLSKNPLTDELTIGIRTKLGKRADEVFNEYSVINTGADLFHRTETTKGKSDMEANDTYKSRCFDGFTGFVYLDKSDKCRGVKVMQYNKDLHRMKYKNGNGIVDWLHRWNDSTDKTMINEDTNEFHECYFGENLLKHGKYKAVGIVESEKTALIGRICCPDILFVAVGGIGKVKYDKFADLGLQRAKVIFYPDAPKEAENEPKNKPKSWGQFVADWQKLAPNWQISKVATENLKNGQDIADILLENPGFADQLNAEAESFSVVEVAPTDTHSDTSSNKGKPKKKDSFLLAMDWLMDKYDIRINIVRGIPQYKPKGSGQWEDLTDDKASAFYSILIKADCKISKNQIFDLFANDEVPRIDPMKEYFEGLRPYNPESDPDYISQLFGCIVGITPPMLKLCKGFFVSIAKNILYPHFIPQLMLVLRGEPRSGKSTFIRFLCPDILNEYYTETPPKDNEKDLQLAMAQYIIINFDELDKYTKYDVSVLKSIITVSEINARRPHGVLPIKLPRRATLLGSCNDAQFLGDTTGNRKYLILEANKINFDYQKIKIDDCYRQAVYLARCADYDCNPTENETETLIADNEKYRIKGSEEELIDRYFYPPKDENAPDAYSVRAVDIMQFLTIKVGTGIRLNKNNIGKAMQTPNRKFIKKRGKDTSYWLVNVREQFKDDWESILHSIYNDDTYRNKIAQPEPIKISFDADYNSTHNTYKN